MEKVSQRSEYFAHRSNNQPGIPKGIGRYDVIRFDQSFDRHFGWSIDKVESSAIKIFAVSPDHAVSRAKKLEAKSPITKST